MVIALNSENEVGQDLELFLYTDLAGAPRIICQINNDADFVEICPEALVWDIRLAELVAEYKVEPGDDCNNKQLAAELRRLAEKLENETE